MPPAVMGSLTGCPPWSLGLVVHRRAQYQQPQQQQHDTGAKQELGPFSLSASGGMGKQGDRSARSMYIDYFDERERMHGAGGDDV